MKAYCGVYDVKAYRGVYDEVSVVPGGVVAQIFAEQLINVLQLPVPHLILGQHLEEWLQTNVN